ncbi:helix-turn-helix transcriptional regulator [Vibrio mangrovi]|uniref:Bifunctional ligase/repressor BirA n=1 Tax=Vibrio mangrovi TaxID=474394 RepID=A0A1Y6IXR8_9VIBR|nr:YafY family protein [Vibrio mangrovi]MDW6002274.1 YafY family protein [Vibrio mangrovi]SMS01620.1 Bifunctional ligase/repressor BirA [Vibrio mangrovi]
MRKSDRLFQLTNILRKHQPITAKKLAEKLMVSERTIYRYIDDLSVSGIPVYGEPGIGYRLSEGFELPPLQLSPNELEALITGVNFIASLTGKDFASSAHSLLSKIEAAMPDTLLFTADKDRTVRVPATHSKLSGYHLWEKVHSAIKSGSWLVMTYESISGNVTTRTVFPLGLFYWGGKWTVGCWCNLRSDYRDFRVDHIVDLNLSGETPVLPENISLQAYITIREKHESH